MTAPRDWLRELSHSWPLLQGERRTEIATAPLPLGDAATPVRAGVDGTGARHLLVPVGDEEIRLEPVEGALLAEVRTYTFASVPRRYVDISCSRPDLFRILDEILSDILVGVADAPHAPAHAALHVLEHWRTLLATRRARLLTLVGQMSLVGELTVLDLITRGDALDISCWRGPRREPHDIVLPRLAVEVKAIGTTSTEVEIHGVHQLEPPGVPLALVLATVAQSDSGTTLPELVERILARATDRGRAVRLLTAAGYAQADAERYRERFAVTEIAHTEVTDTVPRIVPKSFGVSGVPAGVDGITYRIELGALDSLVARGETALTDWTGALR